MKKITNILIIVLLLFSVSVVFAQQDTGIEQLFIQIKPEYDNSEVLVVYNIVLPENTSFPAEISVNIPASSGGPAFVWEVVEGQPVETIFDSTANGDWITVTITTNSPVVYLDYYDPGLNSNNATRNFSYSFPPGLSAEVAGLEIWQPPQTTNFKSTPNIERISTDEYEFIYHSLNISPEDLAGFTVNFSYEFVEIAESDSSSGISTIVVLQWVLIILGIGIIGFGVYKYFDKPKTIETPKKSRKRSRSIGKQAAIFCHECGKKNEADSKFCSECGTKTR